jgi:hypothetical protein
MNYFLIFEDCYGMIKISNGNLFFEILGFFFKFGKMEFLKLKLEKNNQESNISNSQYNMK